MIEDLVSMEPAIVYKAKSGATLKTLYEFVSKRAPHASESLILTTIINACARNGYYFRIRALRLFVQCLFASDSRQRRHTMALLSSKTFETIVNNHPERKIAREHKSGVLFDAKMGCHNE